MSLNICFLMEVELFIIDITFREKKGVVWIQFYYIALPLHYSCTTTTTKEVHFSNVADICRNDR